MLFYARQNLQDILTQHAVCVNGYLALDVLKKTGREMINGCNRVATTGMGALAVAQTVARATGNQVQAMGVLNGVNETIGALMGETGKQLNRHVEQTAQFATNPMIGIKTLQGIFDQTFKAMDAMDSFRSKAIDVMGRNNEIIRSQLAKSEGFVDRVRQQRARGGRLGDRRSRGAVAPVAPLGAESRARADRARGARLRAGRARRLGRAPAEADHLARGAGIEAKHAAAESIVVAPAVAACAACRSACGQTSNCRSPSLPNAHCPLRRAVEVGRRVAHVSLLRSPA